MYSYEDALAEHKRMVDFRSKHYYSSEPAEKQDAEAEVEQQSSPVKITPIYDDSANFLN
jgi:hypothetical protein